MRRWYYLRLSIVVSCLLVAPGVPGFSFVTPEHYEKLKQEARSKEKNDPKSEREVPGRFQVHPPSESKPSPQRPFKK
jgi:hypothetical protein